MFARGISASRAMVLFAPHTKESDATEPASLRFTIPNEKKPGIRDLCLGVDQGVYTYTPDLAWSPA